MEIYIVHTPGWESEFDSAWITEEEAQDRADAINPGRDWGLITKVTIGTDPEDDDYQTLIDRR